VTDKSDRMRMAAVDAARLRLVQPKRDKRVAAGRKRYARAVGDGWLLLGACQVSSPCVRAGAEQGGVCPSCGGAVLTPEEKRDAVPPG
jgi:hypothetical protein